MLADRPVRGDVRVGAVKWMRERIQLTLVHAGTPG
jgi:hypothetical protein